MRQTLAVSAQRVSLLHFAFVPLALLCAATATMAEDEEWLQLFNGRDLTGWTPKIRGHEAGVNFGDTFTVEDGVMKVGYGAYEKFEERFGHLFYDAVFRNYRLRVEYRFTGDQVSGGPGWALRNSGIMVHGQTPESMTIDQDFPASIEVQLLGGGEKGERTTGNLCTPGTNVVMDDKLITRHCTNSSSKTYRGDVWVTAEVEVLGNRVRHWIEGDLVLEYFDPQLDDRDGSAQRLLAAGHDKMLRAGTISLQSESHPCEFRKVEILELDDEDGWHDLSAAKDLDENWRTKGNWSRGEDGVIALEPRPGESGWSRFDAYLWSKESYGEFELEFDYRLEAKSNSGFYFHVGDVASPVSTGIEVQIYDTRSRGDSPELNDHDSGGIIPRVPPVLDRARPAGEWNRMSVRCADGRITVILNGDVVNRLPLDDPRIAGRPDSGPIGFQDHALPIELRRIRVRKIEK